MIEIKHLHKSIQGKPVLKDISLNVEKKQVLALIGPSGCGKTTLLRLIAGLEKPDEGSITIDGVNVSNSHHVLPPHRRRLGMIFQDLALWPHMTVRQHLEYVIRKQKTQVLTSKHKDSSRFKFLRPLRVFRGEKIYHRKKISRLLDAVELSGHSDRYPHQLSGGEQQRLAIVRALAQEPAYLLMDEPFSNLDPILKEDLQKLIGQIYTGYKIGIIYVTHSIKDLEIITDKVAIMQAGRLIQMDNKATVFKHPASRFVKKILGV